MSAPDPIRAEALRLAVDSMKPATQQGSTEIILARAQAFAVFLGEDQPGSGKPSGARSGAKGGPA